MRIKTIPFLLATGIILAAPVFASAQTDESTEIEKVHSAFSGLARTPTPLGIDKVIDGLHFLASDKTIYELPNLRIPEGFPEIEQKAKNRLEQLTKDQRCTLYQTRKADTGRQTRMGYQIAQLECSTDNIWIEGQMAREGLAIVWPSPSNPDLFDDLLKEETKARTEKHGLWGENGITIQTPETVKSHQNSFQIIEGQVETTALTKKNLYLNFEPNWKEDFTIGVSPELQRAFAKKSVMLQSLKGRYIRVRGWVRNYNGPFIEIEQTGQLEILDKPSLPSLDMKSPKVGMKTISKSTSLNEPTTPTIIKPSIETPQLNNGDNQ